MGSRFELNEELKLNEIGSQEEMDALYRRVLGNNHETPLNNYGFPLYL